jgi:broad specificity phosphatase PhoE
MQVVLVRHGPTQWNAQDRFQGRSDIPLSLDGRADASAIAAALRDERIDKIYSSDLIRAMETARIIAEGCGTQVVAERRLREFDFGRWEGLTWREIVAANPHLASRPPAAATLYAPEGGETFADVCKRVREFLDDLRAEDPDARVLVVTHAGPLHAFLALLDLTKPAADFDRFAPGGITRVALDENGARLIALNDRRHLDRAG